MDKTDLVVGLKAKRKVFKIQTLTVDGKKNYTNAVCQDNEKD